MTFYSLRMLSSKPQATEDLSELKDIADLKQPQGPKYCVTLGPRSSNYAFH